jgi:hypothetical protein
VNVAIPQSYPTTFKTLSKDHITFGALTFSISTFPLHGGHQHDNRWDEMVDDRLGIYVLLSSTSYPWTKNDTPIIGRVFTIHLDSVSGLQDS